MGFGAFMTPGSWTGKNSRSGSELNIPDHISESLKTIFRVKTLQFFKFFYADAGTLEPGSGMEKIRIRDKHPGSATLNSHLDSNLGNKQKNPTIFGTTATFLGEEQRDGGTRHMLRVPHLDHSFPFLIGQRATHESRILLVEGATE
jgi:hypothetical protein